MTFYPVHGRDKMTPTKFEVRVSDEVLRDSRLASTKQGRARFAGRRLGLWLRWHRLPLAFWANAERRPLSVMEEPQA